jgi:threonine/homoserine/homoserine lactone efflux protein
VREARAAPVLTFLALGAGIGFIAGISPGPVLTLVVSETLRGGWLRGSAVAAGPLLADGPIVLVAVGVLGQIPNGFIPAVSLVGGAFLLYLAVTVGLNARSAVVPRDKRLSGRTSAWPWWCIAGLASFRIAYTEACCWSVASHWRCMAWC